MAEELQSNESALELRLKQITRYVTLGLVGVLALCALLFMYVGSVKQNEQAAISNSQVQADQTKDSTFCSIYPNDQICVLSRKIAADPTQSVIPKDGIDGQNGEKGDKGDKGDPGKGVSTFAISPEGSLMVEFSDGSEKNLGKVVGKAGIDGVDGRDGDQGRGILSAGLDSGNLVVRYSDGSTENVGMVVGPAGQNGLDGAPGKDGAPGVNGKDGVDGQNGAPGAPGISVIDLKVDSAGYVQVTYSDGTVKPAGQVIVNTITKLSCAADLLTITMVDGSTLSTPVDCTPDNFPNLPTGKLP